MNQINLFPVDILLKPTGNAPIMKKKKWTVDSEKPIGWIIEFIKKYIKIEPTEKLVYIIYGFYIYRISQIIICFSFCTSIKHLLLLRTKLLGICMIATALKEN